MADAEKKDEDLEKINEIIKEKFHGDSCLYLAALRDIEVWKGQLEKLPLNDCDKEEFGKKISDIILDQGGNPEAVEKAMGTLFETEISTRC